MSSIDEDLKLVPGIKFVDHVAIAVKQGELDRQVEAYAMLGFQFALFYSDRNMIDKLDAWNVL